MKRIYTRTGDRGTTAIHGGARVAKTDPRIEANGALDELNTDIGVVRALLGSQSALQPMLRRIQLCLMTIMSCVATPAAIREDNPNKLPEGMTRSVEEWIDSLTATDGPADSFLLPGATVESAFMHRARVAARRAERRLWALNEIDPVDEAALEYVNRLSDLFFVMARSEALSAGMPEERWKEFLYKRNSGERT